VNGAGQDHGTVPHSDIDVPGFSPCALLQRVLDLVPYRVRLDMRQIEVDRVDHSPYSAEVTHGVLGSISLVPGAHIALQSDLAIGNG
jgi:hypothetical protein